MEESSEPGCEWSMVAVKLSRRAVVDFMMGEACRARYCGGNGVVARGGGCGSNFGTESGAPL